MFGKLLGMEALSLETIGRYRRRLALTKPDFSWNQLDDEQFLYRLNAIGRIEGDIAFHLVSEKITAQLKTPFRIEGMVRVENTPVHAALREALVNTIVHANYHEQRGLVILKNPNGFQFENPGSLRVKLEEAIHGGISDPRNTMIFTMFTLINLGERAGSGLLNIFTVW